VRRGPKVSSLGGAVRLRPRPRLLRLARDRLRWRSGFLPLQRVQRQERGKDPRLTPNFGLAPGDGIDRLIRSRDPRRLDGGRRGRSEHLRSKVGRGRGSRRGRGRKRPEHPVRRFESSLSPELRLQVRMNIPSRDIVRGKLVDPDFGQSGPTIRSMASVGGLPGCFDLDGERACLWSHVAFGARVEGESSESDKSFR
jgi:hypothetical protein